ncbi:unnamed protein product [Ambrosiozyma monospora]|uniref:Unnamed protein product n=1 Tax=Ambrosiozyma monospora TaxID=43982 RepID=A0ACB5U767_AMBMO|nr:unnamed protein product [Ambrosiozyma monospora]
MSTLQESSAVQQVNTHSSEHHPTQKQFHTTEKYVSKLETGNDSPSERLIDSENNAFDDDGFDYPENNVKRWLVVLGAFFGLVPTWGLANSIGVIQTQVLEHQLSSSSTTTVSWVFAIYKLMEMTSTVFSGQFFDRNGALWPLLVGTIISAGSLFGTANATTVYQFVLSFGIGFGLGSGVLMAPIIGSVSHYFRKKERATALALATMGGSVGGVLFPAMLRKSFQSIGFR